MSDNSLHIVVFPWLAFGHMIPFLELSKSLAKRGHRITYISTPRNIQRLPAIQPDLCARIQLLSFPLPPEDHLPELAESTGDLPPEKVQFLKKAFDGLEVPFSTFLKSACADNITRPDWVIMDFALHWLPKIADECRVPCTYFSILPASAMAFFGPLSEFFSGSRTSAEDFTVPPNWVPFPSNIAFRLYEARSILSQVGKNASGVTDEERIISVIKGSKFISLRSSNNLQSKWIALVKELLEKEVVPVGLLPPCVDESQSRKITTLVGDLDVMDWLERQPAQSVLYIAFGSEATLSMELLHEIALGIEMAKVRFLWALRKPVGMSNYSGILPDGFEERTKEFGVVAGWVAQMNVLAHPSVGGFLTHCGWSSVIENFQYGHPLITLPIFVDQGLNARIVEEEKVCVPIPRDEETGNFSSEEVAKVIRFVMLEEDGKVVRSNAKKMTRIFTDRSAHEKDIDEFVEMLKKLKKNV